jgi:regulator of protease activity HflC (stomatin/prohibitin superfamily)
LGYFVFVGLLLLIGVVGLFVGRAYGASQPSGQDRFGNDLSKSQAPLIGMAVLAASLLIAGIVTMFFSTDQVENGHIGIKKQFGSLVGTTGEGLVFHAPWQSVSQVSVQDEKRIYKMGNQVQEGTLGVNVAMGSAVSQDSQAVSLLLQVNYSLQRDKAVVLYRETGGNYLPRVLDNAVAQAAKANTAAFKAIDFAGNREKVRANIEKALNSEVEPRGILINNVSMVDVGYSDTLAQAVEQTVEAEQQAKRAEAQVRIKEAEAQQAIAEARGAATAQRLRQRTLTPLLIQQQAIEKLNPNVQVIICPPRTVCVPNANVPAAQAENENKK